MKHIKNARDVIVFSHDQKKLHIFDWYLLNTIRTSLTFFSSHAF